MSITAYGFANTEYKLTQEIIAKYEQKPEISGIYPVFQDMLGLSYTSEVAFKAELSKAMKQISWIELETGTEIDSSSMYQAILFESKQLNSYLVLLGILGFVASYAFSLGPVMRVVLSEIFPPHLRGIGISIVGFLNSFTSWVTQFVFPIEITMIGHGFTYAIFSWLAAIGWWVIYRYLPETKGKRIGKTQ